ncbi:hypothetical protein [Polaribacter haliotis]|nr:hypothetical protein [Polaribacter haliotis]
MKSTPTIETENKKSNPLEIVHSKRATWNTRRKYNYKYITTVF